MKPVRHGMARSGVLDIAYEDWGDPEHPAILLIMGLGAQMLLWPDGFCETLARAGYRVIRFDNRDIGLSGKTTERHRIPRWMLMMRSQLGLTSTVPYSLLDMEEDAIALLDHLGIAQAHVVGASMGGMIAQVLAARHPERVRSLSIFFSSTNQPLLPPPAPSVMRLLFLRPPRSSDRDQALAHVRTMFDAIGSPAYPMSDEDLADLYERMIARSTDSGGMQRQMTAILGTGDLRTYSRRIAAPTLVMHGQLDRLLPPACGRAVARAIPGAKFELIPGMGHDLPRALWPALTGLLLEHMATA